MAVNRHCLQYTVYDDDRRVTRSLALCVCFVDRCLSFCTFSFGYCVVCSSSIYRFWLPLWYLQTLLSCSCFHRLLNYLLFTYFAFERISLMLFQKLIALNLISKFSLIKTGTPRNNHRHSVTILLPETDRTLKRDKTLRSIFSYRQMITLCLWTFVEMFDIKQLRKIQRIFQVNYDKPRDIRYYY
jgi:hypothetical protein